MYNRFVCDAILRRFTRIGAHNTAPVDHNPTNNEITTIEPPTVYNRRRRVLLLLQAQPAVVNLVGLLSMFPDGGGGDQIRFYILAFSVTTGLLIFRDAVLFLLSFSKVSRKFLAVDILVELVFISAFLFEIYWSLSKEYIALVPAVLCLLIVVVSIVFVYLDARAYSKYRRYKQNYRKITPLVVFTETGSPVAVFPHSGVSCETYLERLSVDSLQQVSTDQDSW
ncbi:hypothetical protein F5B18DRAFT_641194 [Nemania serpens]|nr:hypothetical protein F5B18DRAFT_641194 [Nemania serpens]